MIICKETMDKCVGCSIGCGNKRVYFNAKCRKCEGHGMVDSRTKVCPICKTKGSLTFFGDDIVKHA